MSIDASLYGVTTIFNLTPKIGAGLTPSLTDTRARHVLLQKKEKKMSSNMLQTDQHHAPYAASSQFITSPK